MFLVQRAFNFILKVKQNGFKNGKNLHLNLQNQISFLFLQIPPTQSLLPHHVLTHAI